MDTKITLETLFNEVTFDGYLILSVLYELSKRNKLIFLNNLYKLLRVTFNIEEYSITYLLQYLKAKEIIRFKNVFSTSLTEPGTLVCEETLVYIKAEVIAESAFKHVYDMLSPFHKEVFDKLKYFDLNKNVSDAELNDMLSFTFTIEKTQ